MCSLPLFIITIIIQPIISIRTVVREETSESSMCATVTENGGRHIQQSYNFFFLYFLVTSARNKKTECILVGEHRRGPGRTDANVGRR